MTNRNYKTEIINLKECKEDLLRKLADSHDNYKVLAINLISELIEEKTEREHMVKALKKVMVGYHFYTAAHTIAKETLQQVGELE